MSKSLLSLAEQRHQQNMDSLLAVMHLQLNAECKGTKIRFRWSDHLTNKLHIVSGNVKSVSIRNNDHKLDFLIDFICPENGSTRTVTRTCEELYE